MGQFSGGYVREMFLFPDVWRGGCLNQLLIFCLKGIWFPKVCLKKRLLQVDMPWDMGAWEIWGLDPDHHFRPKFFGTTICSAGRKPPGICGASNLWYAQNNYPIDILKTAQVWQTKKKNQVSTTAVAVSPREQICLRCSWITLISVDCY